MIKQLSKLDKVINFQHKSLIKKLSQKQIKLYTLIDKYLDEYARFHKMNVKKVLNCHKIFMKRYIKDLSKFEKSFKYPYQVKNYNPKLDRVTYDIVLIMSCLLLSHRFEIMNKVSNFNNYGNKTLVLGAGPGLEILLIEKKIKEYEIYDLEISEFIKKRFKIEKMHQKIYSRKVAKKYDSILCIELLEHLKRPYNLLFLLYESINSGGSLQITTAKNIPQFDHLYNFTNSSTFEEKLTSIGFKIKKKNIINHENLLSKFKANNVYYNLSK
jgi:hypothetical protein